jgi:pSer/pThr/pTyr-binding forkhead associated (FHA) protein
MASNDSSPAIILEVYREGTLIKRAELEEQSITIGSGASAMLRVEDGELSELHAVINVEDDGTLTLLDLGSDLGLVIDGEKVLDAKLDSGDDFAIGDLRFLVTLDDEDEYEDEEEEYDDPTDEAPLDEVAAITGAAASVDVMTQAEVDAEEERLSNSTEDVMAFIMRSGTAQSNLGINIRRPKVLEVNQIWDQVLLDTKHFSTSDMRDVTIGSSVGWRWHFLGVDMGWVPAPLHMVLPYTPPMWSEVSSDWRNEFYSPDAQLPTGRDHTMFEEGDGCYVARVAADWDGFVDVGDKRYTFDELVAAGQATKSGEIYEIPVTEDTRLMVDTGGVIFFSHMVYPGAALVDRKNEDVDYPFIAIISFMSFIGMMFGVIMYFSPKPAANEMVEIPDRFVELLLEKPEPEEKKKKKPSGNPDAGEGAKAKKEEGKVGKKDSKMEKAKGNKVEVKKKELDRQIAENAGVLGALRDAGDMSGMFSSSLDANLTGGIGGLIGAKGTQIGSGGLGARGSGLGGGGTAEGLGGLGTKGIGSGASGYGSGGGSFGAKGEGGIGTVGGDPIILGALDRSLIDEVIKRHMNQIRYCYQRELTKNPALGGKVVIKFVIAKDGTVSSASKKTSTMNNSAVEQCIVGRFMRMQFPEPKGGGIVIVSYPFIFSPG